MGRTVTFKNEAKNLVGAEIKVGDKAPDFSCLIGLDVNTLAHTGTKPRLFSVVPSWIQAFAACRPKSSNPSWQM